MARLLAALVGLVLVLLPQVAAAQGLPTDEPPPPQEIGDIVAYPRAYDVPECDCSVSADWVPQQSPAPPAPLLLEDFVSVVELDVRWSKIPLTHPTPANAAIKMMAHIQYVIETAAVFIVCNMLTAAQHVVNAMIVVPDRIVLAINELARQLIAMFLVFRAWVAAFWTWLEAAYQYMAIMLRSIQTGSEATSQSLLDWLLAAFGFASSQLQMLLGIVGWTAAVGAAPTAALVAAPTSTSNASQLAYEHEIFYMFRGFMDAVWDSQIAWVFLLFIAIAYVVAAIRFMRAFT